jgi:hypothetical protein
MAARNYPSYAVQILDQGVSSSFVMTVFTQKLSSAEREWWYSRKSIETHEIAGAAVDSPAGVTPETETAAEEVTPPSARKQPKVNQPKVNQSEVHQPELHQLDLTSYF